MSTISTFVFERDAMQKAGPFRQMHMKTGNPAGWEAMWGIPDSHAVVTSIRSDNEKAWDLSADVNAQSVLDLVDQQFASAPQNDHVRAPERQGALRTSYKVWGDALAEPTMHVVNSHNTTDLIDTISIDFHCNTDAILSGLHGTITFYVFFYIDAQGHLQSRIDGWSVPVVDDDWRADFGAAGQVSQQISQMLPAAAQALQAYLGSKITEHFGDQTYDMTYTVPGTGVVDNAPAADDADQHIAVCAVPKGEPMQIKYFPFDITKLVGSQ